MTNNPNGTTTTSNTAVKPSAKTLGGVVVGSGLRFVDDFGIKVEPDCGTRGVRSGPTPNQPRTARTVLTNLSLPIGFNNVAEAPSLAAECRKRPPKAPERAMIFTLGNSLRRV